MTSNSEETPQEGRFDPLGDRQSSIGYLQVKGHSLSIDTFIVARYVDFYVHQRDFSAYTYHLTSSAGPLLDLGGGSWLYAATAYGTQRGKQVSIAWSFEYKADEDRLEVGALNRPTHNFFYGVSGTNSPIQFRKDISGKPTLILVSERVFLENNSDPYSICAEPGSYIAFGD